jgi:hypothetical protein
MNRPRPYAVNLIITRGGCCEEASGMMRGFCWEWCAEATLAYEV